MDADLSDKEQAMYDIILKVLDGALTVAQAAAMASVSTRTIYRAIERVTRTGRSGLAHRSRGRAAKNRTPRETIAAVIALYEGDYAGFNFTHFHQKLAEDEGIEIPYTTLHRALTAAGFRSPRARRRGKRAEHPIRPRRSAFGELVQMDASIHPWFGEGKASLHLAIDDATSQLLGAHFEPQETLRGYYMAFAQVLRAHGCPEELYTDRRSVFVGKLQPSSRLEDDATTQFRMAAARMGVIEIHATSVPQAKGRVERAFQTLQDRLVSEMRVARISSMEEANSFLPAFLADHNSRYALPSGGLERAFSDPPSEQEIDLGLAVVPKRKVNGGCVSFRKRRLAPYDEEGRKVLPSGTEVTVLRSLSDKLYLVCGDELWALLDVQTVDFPTPEAVKRRMYVPPKGHPWKEASYDAMLRGLRKAS